MWSCITWFSGGAIHLNPANKTRKPHRRTDSADEVGIEGSKEVGLWWNYSIFHSAEHVRYYCIERRRIRNRFRRRSSTPHRVLLRTRESEFLTSLMMMSCHTMPSPVGVAKAFTLVVATIYDDVRHSSMNQHIEF